MEKFTKKEKIALAVIGLIVLAIFIQVAAHLDLFRLSFSGIKPHAVQEIALEKNLLDRVGVTLSASSNNTARETADKLTDGNIKSFWHVALDQVGQPATITIDLGEGSAKTVQSLAAYPRSDLPRQFLRKATFSGSDNGEDWEEIADISLLEPPAKAEWWQWDFDNNRSYRYYRLQIQQGHEDGSRYNFYSMAEISLFE